jgi:hypothetical protein
MIKLADFMELVNQSLSGSESSDHYDAAEVTEFINGSYTGMIYVLGEDVVFD